MKICIYCDEFQHDKDMFDRDTCHLCAKDFAEAKDEVTRQAKQFVEDMDMGDELK